MEQILVKNYFAIEFLRSKSKTWTLSAIQLNTEKEQFQLKFTRRRTGFQFATEKSKTVQSGNNGAHSSLTKDEIYFRSHSF